MAKVREEEVGSGGAERRFMDVVRAERKSAGTREKRTLRMRVRRRRLIGWKESPLNS